MFSVLKITDADRMTLPWELRDKPVYAVYEQGKMTAYCAFRVTPEEATVYALWGEDKVMVDVALRTALANCGELVDTFRFDRDFDQWDRLPDPERARKTNQIASFLHCCG